MGASTSQTSGPGGAVSATSALPRLDREQELLQDANVVLCRSFEQLYGITIIPPQVRLLNESDLDDYVKNGGLVRNRDMVNLCRGQEIALNPHVSRADRLEILPHEIGHAVLNAVGFNPDDYLPGGIMGPRRVLHELVADTFQAHGEQILSHHKLVGNPVTRWLVGFLTPWSPLMSFLQQNALTMKDILEDPEGILHKNPKFFAPRPYSYWG